MIGTLLEPKDVYTPASQGSFFHCFQLVDAGVFRLARRGCVFYSVMIAAGGSFGRLWVRAGNGRPLWGQPSTFTGSFVLNCYAEGGLIVQAEMSTPPFLTVSWREPDGGIV